MDISLPLFLSKFSESVCPHGIITPVLWWTLHINNKVISINAVMGVFFKYLNHPSGTGTV